MPTKSGYRRLPSRLPEDGSCSTTECATRPRGVCIGWVWPSSISRIRKNACCEEIRGSLGRRHRTNATATLTMLFSRADTRWTPMATLSTFTTGLRIARLPSLGRVFALCWTGWTPMEVANAASEGRICEIALGRLPVCFWVPSPSPESRVYDQTPNLSGLFRLRTGIRVTRRSRSQCSLTLAKLRTRLLPASARVESKTSRGWLLDHGQTFNNPTCQRWPAIFAPGYTGRGTVPRVAPPK